MRLLHHRSTGARRTDEIRAGEYRHQIHDVCADLGTICDLSAMLGGDALCVHVQLSLPSAEKICRAIR